MGNYTLFPRCYIVWPMEEELLTKKEALGPMCVRVCVCVGGGGGGGVYVRVCVCVCVYAMFVCSGV